MVSWLPIGTLFDYAHDAWSASGRTPQRSGTLFADKAKLRGAVVFRWCASIDYTHDGAADFRAYVPAAGVSVGIYDATAATGIIFYRHTRHDSGGARQGTAGFRRHGSAAGRLLPIKAKLVGRRRSIR